MKVRYGAVISAVITLLVFTVLPLYAPSRLPREVGDLLSRAGISLTGFVNQIAVIGVVIAALTLAKGLVDATSPVYLLATIGSSAATLVFTLITLGLGDIGGMGVTTITMDIEGAVNTAVVDLRFFIQLAALTVGLQIIQSILEFSEARKEGSGPEATQHPL